MPLSVAGYSRRRLRQRRAALVEERAKHETEVTAARENAIEGKVAGVDNAKYVELATRHEIEAGVCAAAISQIDTEIGTIEAETAAKLDRAQREASSRTLNSNADAIDKTLAPLIDALSNAQAAIEKARPIIGDVGIYTLFSQLQDQLHPSFEVISGELRSKAHKFWKGRGAPHCQRRFCRLRLHHRPSPFTCFA